MRSIAIDIHSFHGKVISNSHLTAILRQIQTKFTSIQGQDPKNMPYDSSLPVADQVHASVKSSLRNFSLSQGDNCEIDETTYIDTLVLHSPLPTLSQTFEAWAAAESYVPHRIRNLGISNCDLKTLDALNSSPQIRVKPAVLQNRFYQDSRYDIELRSYCRLHEIVFQSFWTLTANPYFLGSPSTAANLLARETGITPAAAVYCLVLGLGNTTVLDGTSNITHMKEDLASPSTVQKYLEEHPENGSKILDIFKKSIGDTI
jgi:diketogulonate reductase-like aldo/keto reductase